ncbi:Copine-7,Copine-3,Copine-9,Copine-5,Copine-6,Copine-2,Copine-4,Copine-8,Copine-1 [Lepeophtheirus salmonis]|uniref:Copine-7,Copine-3,Copine-9,Copine-5,Copine-6,Copi ne-2,Copine-4,Copine-8,Copine-1 n=1 Tax=Lepeophtheirus salmonis TaxID=72036 RepID=A0A7R8H9F5_LEPSM|nr:Copine-7,Copine-3,Copine-9,Copine-5,Copine-6,Copine-2,Copine-4,Copine-8,Copine-1 [Lepeophtheirus salmonis]CAF2948483.1 Copine-7,Copine-3,Copine-9,Copine-5,Copine-6,Copine-2,Copine-4,Copine-8,Copine-1 [Lepeophtheirus salmonis]
MNSKTIKVHSFLDYIRGGTELACTFSIDFTGSNGDPSQIESLHYIFLGFGARLPPDGRVSHLFFVNGDGNNPYCHGIEGVVASYKSCIRRIQLFGPTNFAPSIEHIAAYAKNFRDGSQYFILLIITDGVINGYAANEEGDH